MGFAAENWYSDILRRGKLNKIIFQDRELPVIQEADIEIIIILNRIPCDFDNLTCAL